MTVITGWPEIQEHDPRSKWSYQGGWRTVRTFRGLIEDLERFAGQWTARALDIEIDPDSPPYGTMLVTVGLPDDGAVGDAEQVTDLGSLQGNDLEKDIMEHPKAKAIERQSPGMLALIRKMAADVISDPEPGVNPADGFSVDVGDATLNSWAQLLFLDLVAGVTSFRVSQFVLRRTRVLDARTTIRPSMVNVNKVFTTNPTAGYLAITSVESIPATLGFDLPIGYWIKSTPTVEFLANGKKQHTQEWIYAEDYSQFIYSRAQ